MDNKIVQKKLEEKDIRPSFIRMQILSLLLEKETHLSIDEIYKNLIEKMPTLSKTTIYNNLDLFVEVGLVNIVDFSSSEKRYELSKLNHDHFICNICNNIIDIEAEKDITSPKNLSDYEIQSKNTVYRGICKKCLGK